MRVTVLRSCLPLLASLAGLLPSLGSVRADPVRHPESARPPSFLNDVMPLFTRLGCNQGACHGKGSGQNGFRLSLRGYAPERDYEWLTREYTGRRVSAAKPEESL